MNKKTTEYILILSLSVLTLVFLYFHFIIKDKEITITFINKLVAIAISALSGIATAKIKVAKNIIKKEGKDRIVYTSLAEKEPKTVVIGVFTVFVLSIFF
jgi:predicted small secreted protein